MDNKNECAVLGTPLDIYEIGLEVENGADDNYNKENRNLIIGKIVLWSGFLATITLSFILGAVIF